MRPNDPKRRPPSSPSLRGPAGSLFVHALLFLLLLPSSLTGQEKLRLQAVRLARRGKTTQALDLLETLHRKYPENRTVLYDFITVSEWAGRDTLVLDLFRTVDPARAPSYVLAAAGKAFRNLGKWEEALALYREARKRFPDDPALALGLAWTLYLGREKGNPWENLFQVLRVCREIPQGGREGKEARKLRILAANALGASHLAWRMAKKAGPEILTREERLRIRLDRAAQEVRWGALEPPSRKARFEWVDRAIADLREFTARPEGRTLRVLCDLIQALWLRGEPAQALRIHEILLREGKSPLPYVLPILADCHLQEDEPREAARLYRKALSSNPRDIKCRLGLIYALIDLGETEEAQRRAQALFKELPAWKWRDGNKTPDPNPEKVQAEVAAILAALYGGKAGEAQARLEGLVLRAPADPDLRAELGNLYGRRGWVRRARGEIETGFSLEKDNPGLLAASAWNHLDADEFSQAEKEIRFLRDFYSERREARRLARAWETHGLRQLTAEARAGKSTGDELGSRDYSLESRLYSSPFHHAYRGFLHQRLAGAEFPEGNYRLDRLGAGIEYRSRDLDLEAEASADPEGDTSPGLRLAGTLQLDDCWSLPASASLFSEETPLRALKNDVEADSAGLGLAWRAHESMEALVSFGVMDFDDGNTRRQVLGRFRGTLWRRARSSYDLEVEVYASSNSRRNRPYFNPRRDLSAVLSLKGEWILYRKGDRSFRHSLTLSAGNYWQKDYRSGFVGSIQYGQVFSLNDRLSLEWSARGSRDRYDGEGESSFQVLTGVNWRF